MLISISNTKCVKNIIKWACLLLPRLLLLMFDRDHKGKRRFILMTPAIFTTQVIYDRANRKCIKVFARDEIDLAVIRQIFTSNDYGMEKLTRAREISSYYKQLVASGKTPLIIDCGANSGMGTRYFAETYEQAQVVGIEPDPSNLAQAKRNNQSKRVSLRLAGISNSEGRANIKDVGGGNWSYRTEVNTEGNVQMTSINTLLKEYNTGSYAPFLVKIDIEGFEANLFENNCEWIDQFHILVIELHDWMLPGQSNSNNFLRQISMRNRDFIFHGENVFSISNCQP